MKNAAIALLAGLLSWGAPVPAARADDAMSRKAVQDQLNRAAYGFSTVDLNKIVSVAVPEATIRYSDGATITIEQWKAKMQTQFDQIASMRAHYKLLEAEIEVPRANVTYVATLDYRLKADLEYKYSSVSRWSAMMVKTPNGWRVKHYIQLSEETTRDGTPLPPGVSAPRW